MVLPSNILYMLVATFGLLTYKRLRADRVVLSASLTPSTASVWTGFNQPLSDDSVRDVTAVCLSREFRRAGRECSEAVYRLSVTWPGQFTDERDLVAIRDEANAVAIAREAASPRLQCGGSEAVKEQTMSSLQCSEYCAAKYPPKNWTGHHKAILYKAL